MTSEKDHASLTDSEIEAMWELLAGSNNSLNLERKDFPQVVRAIANLTAAICEMKNSPHNTLSERS